MLETRRPTQPHLLVELSIAGKCRSIVRQKRNGRSSLETHRLLTLSEDQLHAVFQMQLALLEGCFTDQVF